MLIEVVATSVGLTVRKERNVIWIDTRWGEQVVETIEEVTPDADSGPSIADTALEHLVERRTVSTRSLPNRR